MCLIDPKKSFWQKVLFYYAVFLFLPLLFYFWIYRVEWIDFISKSNYFFLFLILYPVYQNLIPYISANKLLDVEVHRNWVRFTYRTGWFKQRIKIVDFHKIDDIEYDQSEWLSIQTKDHTGYVFFIPEKKKLHEKILLLQRKFYEYTDLCNLFIPEDEARNSPNFELINRKEKVRDHRVFWIIVALWLTLFILILTFKSTLLFIFILLYLFLFSFNLFQCHFVYNTLYDLEIEDNIVKLYLKSGKIYQRICFEIDEVYRVNYEEKGFLHDGQIVIVFKDKDSMTIPVKLGTDNYLHDKILQFSARVSGNH